MDLEDDELDELYNLVHPDDLNPNPATPTSLTVTVTEGDVFECRWCDATFTNYKALSLHETGSHRQETCRICGVRVGIRGLPAHEAACILERTGRFDDILPTDACRARLRDFLERAKTPVTREDIWCLVCEQGDPEFVRDIAIPQRIQNRGACWIFQANRISPELFVAPPRRDRRTGPTKTGSDLAPVRRLHWDDTPTPTGDGDD